ncbi:AAA family ATPase [Salinigranum rubrum]|uniref:Replication factor C large subunit n=1 Tax=Salinigranum rubrum TaxID=755307 RepID=A0A2I8VL33_9EURY|nr:replication factor C large subunit [Salinigranum rubrum]AUV82636.1 AAA family ATPase [Salinigranum rubrum]
MADWTEKYRPTTLSEVRGNDTARDEFAEWADTWDEHREPAVLHGSPGVGKTSAAHALAADKGWETVELNASDQRTADVIERFAGRAAMNTTLSGASNADSRGERDRGRQLVILDEADNIHYQKDYGGKQAVTKLLKEANQPVVLIANDFYEMSRGMRSACREIEFRDVSARSIVPVLRDICRREGVEFEARALERIAESNDGDLRSAVRDLQSSVGGRASLSLDDVTSGGRDRTVNIFGFLDSVLKESDSAEEALRTAYDTDETPDDLTSWVEDKVSMVYEGEELARAYDHLANADRWLGRVYATQNYRYWRYATDNVSAGVAASRDRTRGGWTRYGGAPWRSTKNATRDAVTSRIAESAGVSIATARREVLPFLQAMTHHCKPRDLTVAMTAWYDFDTDHVAYVTGSGESTNKVQSIVEEARERREELLEAHAGDAFAREGLAAHAESTADTNEGADDAGENADTSGGTDGTTTLDDLAASADDEAGDEDDTDGDTGDGGGRDDGQSGLFDFT